MGHIARKTPVALFPAQLRAARAMLNWTLLDAARETGVSKVSLVAFETGKRTYLRYATEAALVATLSRHGVDIVTDRSGIGVKLRARE